MSALVQEGRFGRVVTVRIAPNADLVSSLIDVCRQSDLRHVYVRSGLGTLVDARIAAAGASRQNEPKEIQGPSIEILSMSGELIVSERHVDAEIHAILGDPDGNVHAGNLLPGRNLVCVTAEIMLQEWLPAA